MENDKKIGKTFGLIPKRNTKKENQLQPYPEKDFCQVEKGGGDFPPPSKVKSLRNKMISKIHAIATQMKMTQEDLYLVVKRETNSDSISALSDYQLGVVINALEKPKKRTLGDNVLTFPSKHQKGYYERIKEAIRIKYEVRDIETYMDGISKKMFNLPLSKLDGKRFGKFIGELVKIRNGGKRNE